jgi:superfamily II DNA or RNA helicase
VVSRVGDEGISLPDIERVIEVAGLYGSRMQESQRFGRLMHSLKEEPEHIILMTEDEYNKYNKRLYAILERGFKIEFVR